MTSVSPVLISQVYSRAGVLGTQGGSKPDLTGNPGRRTATGSAPDFIDVSLQGRQVSAGDVAAPGGDDADRLPTADRSDRAAAADQAVLRELQTRDREVRAHEQAHLAAAGSYARGGASFVYQKGPDGRMYAVGGEVGIDIGRAATPEETIAKMQIVRRAALAPAEPSAADRQIAAQASIRLAEAQRELQAAALQEQETAADRRSEAGPLFSSDPSPAIPAAEGVPDNKRLLVIARYQAISELLSPRPAA